MARPPRPARAAPYGTALTRQTYAAKLRQVRLEETRATLPPAILGLAFVHLGLAALHLVVHDGDTRNILAAYAAFVGLLLLLVRFGFATPQLPTRHAMAAGLLGAFAALSHAGLVILLSGDPRTATLLVLLQAGAGAVLLSLPLVFLVALASIALYGYAWMRADGGEEWVLPALMLFLAGLAGLGIAAGRVRTLRRMIDLRLRADANMVSMARATRAATESEVRFRRLAEAAFEAIIVHDRGRILDANRLAGLLAGVPAERLVGRHLPELPALAHLLSVPTTQAPDGADTTERIVRHDDGRVFRVEVRARMIPYRGGDATVLALRDVTAARRLETERLRLAERVERILAAAGEGVYGLDLDGNITFVNPAALRLLGYRPEEVIGNDAHALFHHSRADGSPYPVEACPVRNAARTGTATRVDDEVYWRRDRTAVPVEYTTSPIMEDGHPIGAVVVLRDISERREVERMKDELVSVVSHELKTPLTSIHGSLRLLAAGRLGELPTQAKRMVDIAETNTERLMRLINDILDVERFRAGKTNLRKTLVEAVPLVEEAVETMRPLAETQNVQIRTDLAPVTLWCDRDRALQTVTNLLSNAIKFSPPGSTIDVRGARSGEYARFEVRDRGPGIPDALRGRLFQRFVQADASDTRQKGGTGLGLAISKEIVEAHGGTIGHHARDGGGSVFWFTLPVAAPRSGGAQ